MANKFVAAAVFFLISCPSAFAGDDLCSLVKSTVASFVSGGWTEYRGSLLVKPDADGFGSYSTLKTLPGFDRCTLFGGDVQRMRQRQLACTAHINSLDASNRKVKEIGDVLQKCLTVRSQGKSTSEKQDSQYFQLENLAMVSVSAVAAGFLVEPDTVGIKFEITMLTMAN